MNFKAFCLVTIVASAIGAPAFAHHSFAMFDAEKTLTMKGTVKEFEWTNPHAWLRVMVQDQAGQSLQWALEMGSPGQMAGRGWKPESARPGDKVTVTLHPLKDGSRGGQLLSATLPGGQQLSNGGNRNNVLRVETIGDLAND